MRVSWVLSGEIPPTLYLGQAKAEWGIGEGCQAHGSSISAVTGMLFTMSSVHVMSLLRNVSGLKDFPHLLLILQQGN